MREHPVKLFGDFESLFDLEQHYPFGKYPNHRDKIGESLPINKSTTKLIDSILNIDKKNISIVDFGGGNGRLYNTLKKHTSKEFDYKIVDLPEVHREDSNISYYSKISHIDSDVDVLYSDGTLYCVGANAYDIIKGFCVLNADNIVLRRCLLSDNYKKQFFTFAKQLNLPFHILDVKEFINFFTSNGYKLTEAPVPMGDSKKDTVYFNLDGKSKKSPLITYYDLIFIKNS